MLGVRWALRGGGREGGGSASFVGGSGWRMRKGQKDGTGPPSVFSFLGLLVAFCCGLNTTTRKNFPVMLRASMVAFPHLDEFGEILWAILGNLKFFIAQLLILELTESTAGPI